MRHLIDPMDLTVEEIDQLLQVGDDIIKNPQKYAEVCKGKKLYDKRETEAKKTAEREAERETAARVRGE